jgi:hypothetical protein
VHVARGAQPKQRPNNFWWVTSNPRLRARRHRLPEFSYALAKRLLGRREEGGGCYLVATARWMMGAQSHHRQKLCDSRWLLARPKRFELLTPRFVVWCSIRPAPTIGQYKADAEGGRHFAYSGAEGGDLGIGRATGRRYLHLASSRGVCQS